MAQPQPTPFAKLKIKLAPVGDPTDFSANLPMAMVTRTWGVSIATVKRTTPDLENEDELVDEQSAPSTRSRTATGKGKVDPSAVAAFEAATGVIRQYQVTEDGVGTWTGPMILTQFNRTGNRADTYDADVSLEQADKMTFAPPA